MHSYSVICYEIKKLGVGVEGPTEAAPCCLDFQFSKCELLKPLPPFNVPSLVDHFYSNRKQNGAHNFH